MGRILDVNLNRSAEALRVVEDLCRFHWELPGLCRELKDIRHGLLSLFFPDPVERLEVIAYRNIEGDLGREIPSPPPSPLADPSASQEVNLERTAVRNLERAKESFRSLEELLREKEAERSRNVEQLRYRLYSVEKGILSLVGRSRSALAVARLYLLVTCSLLKGPLEEILQGALEGGVDAVQLREKSLPDGECLALGRHLREVTAKAGIPLVVNDRPDMALLLGADGVHVGQDDLPVSEVRRIVGERLAVGISTHNVEQALKAVREGADYIGIGPVFPSTTKEAGPNIGPEGLRAVLDKVDIPAFAIGGIGPENISAVVKTGGTRVAVSSAILKAPTGKEARKAARRITSVLGQRSGDKR